MSRAQKNLNAPFTIGWLVNKLDSNLASVRYRSLYPALALKRQFGYRSVYFESARAASEHLEELDALVIVKHLSSEQSALCDRARSRGVIVVLDICDNVFLPNYMGGKGARNHSAFIRLADKVAVIVTTNEILTQDLKKLLPGRTPEFVEIPDQVETREIVEQLTADLPRATAETDGRAERGFRDVGRRIRRFFHSIRGSVRPAIPTLKDAPNTMSHGNHNLKGMRVPAKTAGRKRIVWFGNHGASHSDFGMGLILDVASTISEFAKSMDLELMVISNNEEKYQTIIAPLPFPSHYIEWSPGAVYDALEGADVCILPGGHDEFAKAKSANRAVLALAAGVPVIASHLTALEPLRNVVVLDDWVGGLRRYLQDLTSRSDVEAARAIIDRTYSPAAIADRWNRVLLDIETGPASSS